MATMATMATVSCCESMNEKFRKAKAPGKLSICKLWKREGRADSFGLSFFDSSDSNEQVFLLVSIIESKIQQLAHLLGRPLFDHSRSNTILYLSKIYPSFREGWNVQRWVMVLLLPNQSMKVAWRSHVLPRERVHGTMSWSKGQCPAQQQTQWIDRDYNLFVYNMSV